MDWISSQSVSLTETKTWTAGGEDAVVFQVIPFDVYDYKVVSSPDPADLQKPEGERVRRRARGRHVRGHDVPGRRDVMVLRHVHLPDAAHGYDFGLMAHQGMLAGANTSSRVPRGSLGGERAIATTRTGHERRMPATKPGRR
jgi:hypothetical protein